MNGFCASKSASKSIICTPCISSASESGDNSKSARTSVVGGNSRASFSLFCTSSIGTCGLMMVSAVVSIGLSTLMAVGQDDDVTFGSSDARTSCADTVITSSGLFAGAVAFPFPT